MPASLDVSSLRAMPVSQLLHHSPVAVAFLVVSITSLVVLAILVARIGREVMVSPDRLVVQVNRLIAATNVERAATVCAAGGTRLVPQLVGVGVDSILRSELRPVDAVERAKGEMAQRLPAMRAAHMPGLITAVGAGALTTLLGLLLLAQLGKEAPMPLIFCLVVPVDALAGFAALAKVTMRKDLVRAVANFGSFGR